MTRLLIAVEGPTEAAFVALVLKPHLESISNYGIDVTAPNMGGYRTYAKTRKFVKNLLASPTSGASVTTMIDLFKIAPDYPGFETASSAEPGERVRQLERNFSEDVADRRFFAYLQLHEFEALLLADPTALIPQYPSRRREIAELAALLSAKAPERVNRTLPPSHRIKEAIPEYQKVVSGAAAAAAIGLPTLRERCPHFGQWLQRLENPTPRPTHSPN